MTICCIVTYYDEPASRAEAVQTRYRYLVIGEADAAAGHGMASLMRLQAGVPEESVGRVSINRGDAAVLLESALEFLDQRHPAMKRTVGHLNSDD